MGVKEQHDTSPFWLVGSAIWWNLQSSSRGLQGLFFAVGLAPTTNL
jgi:hypothetical protein